MDGDKIKKLFIAARDFVQEHGECIDASDFDDEPYCADPDCAYCSLAMAVQQVDDSGDIDS